jgi:transcriptional regulator NrdR family protein
MKCPHCKLEAAAPVVETRLHETGVYRTRKCGACNSRYVTVETAPSGLSMPAAVVNRQRKAYRQSLLDQQRSNKPRVYSGALSKAWLSNKESS